MKGWTGERRGAGEDTLLLVPDLLGGPEDFAPLAEWLAQRAQVLVAQPPADPDLLATLVAAKGGDPTGVAAVVVAGDPNLAGGFNFCNQPGSCGCVEVIPGLYDCDIFHATRLYDFTGMLGSNGYAGDLCAGPMSVPSSVETALTTSIDIACQNYEPEG